LIAHLVRPSATGLRPRPGCLIVPPALLRPADFRQNLRWLLIP
jgi:hypothetical protein